MCSMVSLGLKSHFKGPPMTWWKSSLSAADYHDDEDEDDDGDDDEWAGLVHCYPRSGERLDLASTCRGRQDRSWKS